MASTGFTIAGSGANSDPGSGTAWTGPGNVTADDGTVANVSGLATAGDTTQYLHATNFGFAIPSGATIDGIEVRLNKYKNTSGGAVIDDLDVILIKGGTRSGTGKDGADWPADATNNEDYGSSSDLWGTTLTDTDVNASNFGVAIRAECRSSGASRVARLDAVWINVHYTEGGGETVTIDKWYRPPPERLREITSVVGY